MKKTIVKYEYDYDECGSWYRDLTNDMITGRYKELNDGSIYVEILEPHHILWLYRYTKTRWIYEENIKFEKEVTIYDCKVAK